MAWNLNLRRIHCSTYSFCTCESIPRDKLTEIVMWDYSCCDPRHIGLPERKGIVFKYPPNINRSEEGQPDSLTEAAFKVSAVLVENLIRHKYSTNFKKHLINYHYGEFLETKQQLIEEFSVPIAFAESLLPRFHPPHPESGCWKLTPEIVSALQKEQRIDIHRPDLNLPFVPYRPVKFHFRTRRAFHYTYYFDEEDHRICVKHEQENFDHYYALRCYEQVCVYGWM